MQMETMGSIIGMAHYYDDEMIENVNHMISYFVLLCDDGFVWSYRHSYQTTTLSQVQGLSNIVAISASNAYATALCADGYVWAWGSGADVHGLTNAPMQIDFIG